MKSFILSCMLLLSAVVGGAQHFQFSQYNFASQRINPAVVAGSDYASASLLYRNQSAGDISLNSSIISVAYPILNKRGQRWSGIGATLLDDRSGGIFSIQEASISYGINVFLSRDQSLTLGMKAVYMQRQVNLDGLYTGSQYIPDRGFDRSISNGESISFLKNNFFTFSSGLLWQQTDRAGFRVAHLSLSLFDFNKPADSFLGFESRINSTIILNGGFRIYGDEQVAFVPDILYTINSGKDVVSIGIVTSYFVNQRPHQNWPRIDLQTRYVPGRSGILGLQFHRENFSIGFSYDFPVIQTNSANFGAFEVGLELRRLVESKMRRRTSVKRKAPEPKSKSVTSSTKKPSVSNEKKLPLQKGDSTTVVKRQEPLKVVLQHKQDSALAVANAGNIKHEPLVLEKVVLHFNFEFNSSELDDQSRKYLDDLFEALAENEHLRIKLTGHTDNVGSAKFNLKLSIYRAGVITDYLVEKGISPDRVLAEGRGLSEPLNNNRTEEDRAKNRRVELTILYE